MKSTTHRELWGWGITWALVVTVIIVAFSSCSVVHKVFHREKTKVDSSYSSTFKADSVGSKDSNVTHIEKETTEKEITLDFDTAIYVPVHDTAFRDWGIYVQPDDRKTFEMKADGSISTSQRLKRVTINSKNINLDSLTASLVDHSQITQEATQQGEVKRVEKKVDQQVDKKPSLFSYLWWLLLILAAALIYRNRSKIWAIIIHLFTGI